MRPKKLPNGRIRKVRVRPNPIKASFHIRPTASWFESLGTSWSVAIGEEEAQLANAPGCVHGGVGRGDSAAAAQGRKREVAGDSAA